MVPARAETLNYREILTQELKDFKGKSVIFRLFFRERAEMIQKAGEC